jgi:hypothetical protein
VAFAGPSGRGKSTLAAAFCRAGFPLVSDDVLVVTPREGDFPLAWPSYPQIKLWQDAAERLSQPTEKLNRIRATRERFALPVSDSSCSPLPLKHLYLLELSRDDTFEIATLSGGAKLESLMENTYRPQYLEGLNQRGRHFQACAETGHLLKVKKVFRPRAGFKLDQLVQLLEKDFTG